ncbi:MAG TPA: hypothetical protein VF637_10155 [Sphingomicrobium sp.]|jgi:hypothetical protein
MAASYFIIAILGCADSGSSTCTQVATAPTHYTSKAECTAAMNAVLEENSGFDFPTLMAECRPVARPMSAKSERPAPVTGVIART